MKTSSVPNRSLGKRSPLDTALAETAKAELYRRCQSEDTLAEINQWLRRQHGVKVSDTALSDWWRRRRAQEQEQAPARKIETFTVFASGLEIIVTAPGAESIAVRVKPETAAPGAASR
jgi:hypothetical protein